MISRQNRRQDLLQARALPRRQRFPLPWLSRSLALLVALGVAYCHPAPVAAQFRNPAVPTDAYFSIYGEFAQGEYDNALNDYLSAGRSAIKTVQSNWIDSICYHAMAGECYYQMGQLAKAQTHYNSSLQLYAAFSDWMIRVQFNPVITPMAPGQLRACPWGQSRRPARWGIFPDTVTIAMGQIDQANVVQQGGVVQQAQRYPVRAQEIVRCTALSLRRRAEILGPLGEHDPLAKDVLAALTRRPTQPNHWSECWIDAQLGLAFVAVGKPDQAKPVLERAILAGGEFNHPLTSTVLLELGKIVLAEGDYATAGGLFEEASYAAFVYEDAGILEEAFRFGALTHLIANQPGPYPPLATAANWARAQGYRQLQASLNLSLAETLVSAGENNQAANALSAARGLMGNRAILRGKQGARLNYLNAVALYQTGDAAAADQLLANVLTFQRSASRWMFQIDLTDSQLVQGAMPPRVSMGVYQQLLREPTAGDWLIDPLEALSVIALPHPQSYEHWFEVAVGRREFPGALEIADQGRRHRFLSMLPLGGRPLGLRWVLDAPLDALSKKAQLERQDLLARFPAYDQLAQQAEQLQADLAQLPLVSDEAGARRAQTAGLQSLAEVSAAQEQLLRIMSVRRNPGSLYFPMHRSSKDLQALLAPGQAVLAFVATSRHYYGFLVSADSFSFWEINSPAAIHRKVATLLREMGHVDGNREMQLDQLTSDKWKEPAAELWTTLTDKSKTDLFRGLDELIIVPDRSLWYVPFAALQIGPPGQSEPLIAKIRVRMAPLASMAVPGLRGRSTNISTAVVLGKLSGRDDAKVSEAAFDQFSQAVPGSVALPKTLPVPSPIYASMLKRLVVFDDLRGSDETSLGWSPLPLDANGGDGSLAAWLTLPYPAPDEILLPGFHTAAESALKKRGAEVAGEEIFQSVCALMSCGTQTVLLSQWRTGGQTSYDLVREFTQELPHSTPAAAWQRSVELAMAAQVDPTREPRVKISAKQDPPTAAHPFFWSGYLLVDTGATGDPPERLPEVADAAPIGGVVAPAGAAPPGAPPNPADPNADPLPIDVGAPMPNPAPPAGFEDGDLGAGEEEDGSVRPTPKKKAPKARPPKKTKPRAPQPVSDE